ncbi:MAG: tRNA uracil 4-sulfurtransferase ThiI [Sphaerobacter sp.]|nr:tRNA uracil 4-sulfurtransferase ThiI [Sphaerobacter sp.]
MPAIRPVVVVRVHEVALKGRNRPWFMRMLRRNLAHALRGVPYADLKLRSGRALISLKDVAEWSQVRERLSHVFGVANYSLTVESGLSLDEIREAVGALLEAEGPPVGSFRVRAKRSNKEYPLISPEIERAIGADIQQRTGAPVDLRQPDQTYRVEILHDGAYVSSETIPGPGGLPVGVSGRVVVLMSGGYDSPVAAYRMMKRGCEVTLVHCHAYPFVRSTSIEKVVELAQHLGRHQPGMRLTIVPIGQAQRQIAIASEPEIRVVLYRRLMMRIAEAIALQEGAGAIVTGESLGQVSSQTLDNLRAIGAAVELPILRPLIGFDKDEIMAEAERIGTAPISRVPDDDCCTVFVPRHPTTHATIAEAEAAEAPLDVQALVGESLAQRTDFHGDPARWDVMQALAGAA